MIASISSPVIRVCGEAVTRSCRVMDSLPARGEGTIVAHLLPDRCCYRGRYGGRYCWRWIEYRYRRWSRAFIAERESRSWSTLLALLLDHVGSVSGLINGLIYVCVCGKLPCNQRGPLLRMQSSERGRQSQFAEQDSLVEEWRAKRMRCCNTRSLSFTQRSSSSWTLLLARCG